ncbi:MAG: 4-hydroxy-tetrahydrodipicolinate synthase [Cellulosilyticum sp.]|nr:4-hydroxy-tetrahydrodipicolinate synthase [Cellulosilyticum sp.]
MKQRIFEGSGVAIITPFNEKGIDYNKFEELIEWHIAEGTDAIIVCGTTGESATLPIEDHKALIKFCVDTVNHRIPVIAGAGSNDTYHAINTTQYAESVGVDGILSVVPYYNKPSQRGLYTHFETIAKSTKAPIILYNVPGRTGLDMSPQIVKELAQIDNIVAIKECNFNHIGELRNLCGPDFAIYSGEDDKVLPVLAMGGQGVISVMANIIPKDTHEIYARFMAGDIKGAQALQLKVLNLVKALFIESSPSPTKEAMNILGMNVGECRLPIVGMEPNNKAFLHETLKAYGLLK